MPNNKPKISCEALKERKMKRTREGSSQTDEDVFEDDSHGCPKCKSTNRGTQRQFSENICSEDDLRSRILGTFVEIFLACLPQSPRIFENLKTTVIAHF